eukprot:scaffold16426_cov109-Isochrysis_galbana.AAC.9
MEASRRSQDPTCGGEYRWGARGAAGSGRRYDARAGAGAEYATSMGRCGKLNCAVGALDLWSELRQGDSTTKSQRGCLRKC